MNLYAKLQARASQQKPIRVALIGAGNEINGLTTKADIVSYEFE